MVEWWYHSPNSLRSNSLNNTAKRYELQEEIKSQGFQPQDWDQHFHRNPEGESALWSFVFFHQEDRALPPGGLSCKVQPSADQSGWPLALELRSPHNNGKYFTVTCGFSSLRHIIIAAQMPEAPSRKAPLRKLAVSARGFAILLLFILTSIWC